MESGKSGKNKRKIRNKLHCSSIQASKFIEKNSKEFEFGFSNVPLSLCDFIPTDQDYLFGEIDLDISKNLRKLEKKDPLTKQKSLKDLLEMLKYKDELSVISTLKYWPKLYNRLSLDDDKKVRELTQYLMGAYSRICGKEISSVIKQLLPTWIIAQSDMHVTVANIAKQSFYETFPSKIKQEKAYLLCWQNIYEIISRNLSQTPPKINESEICFSTSEEAYIQDIVVNIRTIITLIPYLKSNKESVNDLITLFKSKNFWSHFKQKINIIQSIYIQLGTELLDNIPDIVINNLFVSSNVCECFRMVDNYHPHLLSRIWTSIVKCCEHMKDQIWKFVSFKTTFLPKFLKMLECAADGNISQIYTCMMPFFTYIPFPIDSIDSNSVFEQILITMMKSSECTRVICNELESNCNLIMILECSVYTLIASDKKKNKALLDIVLHHLLEFCEKYFTEIRMKKATNAISSFINCLINPLIIKATVPMSCFLDQILTWFEKNYTNAFFCENLTVLLSELEKYDENHLKLFHISLIEVVQPRLKEKIIENHQNCLIPYFYTCFSNKQKLILDQNDVSDYNILIQCPYLIQECNVSVTEVINRGLSKLLCDSSTFDKFLQMLKSKQINVFFTRFYVGFISNIESDFQTTLAQISLFFWKQVIPKSIRSLFIDNDIDCRLWVMLLDLCIKIECHKNDIEVLVQVMDQEINDHMNQSMSMDQIEQLISIMKQCLSLLIINSNLSFIPKSFVKNLLKLILCVSTTSKEIDIDLILTYLKNCDEVICIEVSKELINEIMLLPHCDDLMNTSYVIKKILENDIGSSGKQVIIHVHRILLEDLSAIENELHSQLLYSSILLHSKHGLMINAINKINILIPLISFKFDQDLNTSIKCSAVLINSILTKVFSSCHNSNKLLNECEKVYKFVQSLDMSHFQDDLILCASTGHSELSIFNECPTLVLFALHQIIPVNYSQWSDIVRNTIDFGINSWTESELTHRQLLLICHVLIPVAIRARYLVQEIMIATIVSYLSDDINLTCSHVNRVLIIITALSKSDSNYFRQCFPILLNVRSKFDAYLDQLHTATIINPLLNDENFQLTMLLEFLSIGVENCTLNQNEWEFVFCLIDTLFKSPQFIDCSNYRSDPISDNKDHLLNVYWLLRLISTATVSLASVKIDLILDEWENLFCEPIYTAILDQFSFVSGDHRLGKMIYSDLFVFYLEALTDTVSLCPINVLLGHNFSSQININDPIDLPKDFLIVFNALLESMSSYSLSVQLAAYNCLLNLTEKLSNLLLEQVNASECVQSLDLFSINLPQKLLEYMVTENLDQHNIDQVENQIYIIRCFLSWNIVLELFSNAQPKLRAEISTFLVKNDRCFDKFLNFCFAIMPKNPIINKKHLSFIQHKHSCNLVIEEPQIFTQFTEKRSKFVIYHLSTHIFRRSMQILPNLCRNWWKSLDTTSQQSVDSFVRLFLTRELFTMEFKQLKEVIEKHLDDKIEIKAIPLIGEVTVKYNVSCDQSLEQLIRLPNNYPIGSISSEYKKEMTVRIPHWKHWVNQMTMTLENQNGSIYDGVRLWKRNLDNYFNGIEECMICYSILHQSKYTLPSMPCYQCKKKFHKECMFKWFHSSTNPTCPNCRNVFYDGSQKTGK